MSATVVSDKMAVTMPENQPTERKLNSISSSSSSEVEFAKCECCGLTEECTQAYIQRIRERYHGKWICGLCAEAVKDEMVRSTEEEEEAAAMARHMNFCKQFVTSGPPCDPTLHLISVMRQVLRRSLDSPRGFLRSSPTSPTNHSKSTGSALARSESCFPSLSG